MRYHLPPPDEEVPRSVGAIARAGPTAGATAHELEAPGTADGRLLRTVTLGAGEASAYLRRWAADPPPAHPATAPAGVRALERSRADRVVPGARRRQRLAVREDPGGGVALHWSALEPVSAADETAWQRALERLAGGGAVAPGGWRA